MVSSRGFEHLVLVVVGVVRVGPLVVVAVGPGGLEDIGIEIADPVLECGLAADHLGGECPAVESAFKGDDDLFVRAALELAVGAGELEGAFHRFCACGEHEGLGVGDGAYADYGLGGLNTLTGRVQVSRAQGLFERFSDSFDDLGVGVAGVRYHDAGGEVYKFIAVRVADLVAVLGVVPDDEGLARVGDGLVFGHFPEQREGFRYWYGRDDAPVFCLDPFCFA